MRITNRFRAVAAAMAATLVLPIEARAWGDEGHEVVALISDHFLTAATHQKVMALLSTDSDTLTAHDIASEATWADRFRDSDRNSTKVRYNQTQNWHFVDIDLAAKDIDAACFGHPVLPADAPASNGAPKDCIVDKIDEFTAELTSPTTSSAERLFALKFILHFVGDVHQPLHSSNDHDFGGNSKMARTAKAPKGTLHHYWDTEFIKALGADANAVAARLIAGITTQDLQDWQTGSPTNWAYESFGVAYTVSYGALQDPVQGVYLLDADYEKTAVETTALQLSKAGVRLAQILNRALGP